MTRTHMQLWLNRPCEVDCRSCCFNSDEVSILVPTPCERCEGTGLEPIPWAELFSHDKWLRRSE